MQALAYVFLHTLTHYLARNFKGFVPNPSILRVFVALPPANFWYFSDVTCNQRWQCIPLPNLQFQHSSHGNLAADGQWTRLWLVSFLVHQPQVKFEAKKASITENVHNVYICLCLLLEYQSHCCLNVFTICILNLVKSCGWDVCVMHMQSVDIYVCFKKVIMWFFIPCGNFFPSL